ncbi:MAG: hypothetical protein QOJ90_2441 [Actinomycetota bacterium]|nr:hypothetical protein [Actinomycetota bacterium]MDQ1643090.1 hypothetical protein [Actinomycetota bacterium]
MEEFRSRGAPLEYWFIKVRSGDLAFLVDWIIRRGSGEAEVRVSLFVRGTGRVLRTGAGAWGDSDGAVRVNGCTLTPGSASGEVDDVRWDLTCDPGETRLDPVPLPAKLLHPFDLELAGRPRARFTGSIEVAGETFTLAGARGTLNHYWGRRLPDSWVWVSADGLGDGDGVVEAALIRTRLWGLGRCTLLGGYAMVDGGSRTTQILAPTYGHLAVEGSQESFAIKAWTRGRQVTLTATAPSSAYNDLGDGIRQTLIGDVTVDGWGSSTGYAGLEYRGDFLRPR